MQLRHPLVRSAVLLALLGLLAACSQPAAVVVVSPTAVAFDVLNPDAVTGELFGVLFEPFQTEGEHVVNAFASGSVDAQGRASGTLRTADQVSRINDGIGFFIFGDIFRAPDGCTFTVQNASDAALAIVLDIAIWDGASRDADGYPSLDAFLQLGSSVTEIDINAIQTDSGTFYAIAMSRTAWSASTGACVLDNDDVFDLDVAFDVGWQVLRIQEIKVTHPLDGISSSLSIDTMSLEALAELGIVGTIQPNGGILFGAGSASEQSLRAQIVPWSVR